MKHQGDAQKTGAYNHSKARLLVVDALLGWTEQCHMNQLLFWIGATFGKAPSDIATHLMPGLSR